MYSITEQDYEKVHDIVDAIGDILEEIGASNVDALIATLFIAVRISDDMEMDKKVFLMNCENMYDGQSINAKPADGVTIQ
jgi:hypothetical protein